MFPYNSRVNPPAVHIHARTHAQSCNTYAHKPIAYTHAACARAHNLSLTLSQSPSLHPSRTRSLLTHSVSLSFSLSPSLLHSLTHSRSLTLSLSLTTTTVHAHARAQYRRQHTRIHKHDRDGSRPWTGRVEVRAHSRTHSRTRARARRHCISSRACGVHNVPRDWSTRRYVGLCCTANATNGAARYVPHRRDDYLTNNIIRYIVAAVVAYILFFDHNVFTRPTI